MLSNIVIYNCLVMKDTETDTKSKISQASTNENTSTRDCSVSIPNRKFEELDAKIVMLTKQKLERIYCFLYN